MDNSNREVVVPFGPEQPVVTIGRATDCVIRSNRRSVSRHHAEFRYHQGQYEVVDLGSANGTYLIINENRQRIEGSLTLNHSDEVWCGDFILYFEEDEVDYYEPLPYDGEADSDPTYGDHSPIPAVRYDDSGGYQNPPMYDQGYDQGYEQQPAYDQQQVYEPPPQNWNASNPGAAPFPTSPPPPPEPSQFTSSGSFGAKPYAPEPVDYYEPQDNPGQALYPTTPAPASPPPQPEYYQEPAPVYQEPSAPQEPAWQQDHGDTHNEAVPRPPMHDMHGHAAPVASGPSAEEMRALQQEVQELKLALDQSKQQQGELEQQLDHARSQDQSAALAAEVSQLKSALAAAQQSANADEALKAQIADMQKQIVERDERIEGYRRRITQAEEEATRASRLRDDLRDREKDIEQLHQELDRQREEARLARDEARKSRESAERARASLQTAERAAQEGMDLKKELDRHKRLLDEIERRNRDLTAEFNELETLSKELEQMLQEKTSEANSLRTLANNHEKRLGELSTDSSKFNQELKKTRQALDEAMHKAERFEVLSNQLTQELDALKVNSSREIEDLGQRLDVSSRDSAVAIAKLTNQRDELVAQRDGLQDKLDAVEPEMKALRSEIEGLKQRLRMEKKRSRQDNSKAEQLASVQDELTAVQSELANAQGELASTQSELTSARGDVENARGEVEKTQLQLDEALHQNQTLSEQIQQLQLKLEASMEQQSSMPVIDIAEVDQLRQHNQSLRDRLNRMEQHLDDVSSQATIDVPALREESQAIVSGKKQAANVQEALQMLDALDRVVDAIARTDLGPLGTVDRIRLQSALRDTNPRQTLENVKTILGG